MDESTLIRRLRYLPPLYRSTLVDAHVRHRSVNPDTNPGAFTSLRARYFVSDSGYLSLAGVQAAKWLLDNDRHYKNRRGFSNNPYMRK